MKLQRQSLDRHRGRNPTDWLTSVCPSSSLRPVHFSAKMSCSYPRSVAPSASPVVSDSRFVVFSSEDSFQETRLLFQPLCLEKNALENSWQESEAFVEFHSWPASLRRRVPERSRSARSRPSEQRFQLVQPRLRVRAAPPRRPQPAALLPQPQHFLWKRSPPPAVPEGVDLVGGRVPDLELVVEVVETVCQNVHRAGAERAARSPRLVDGVLGAFRPHADASAGKSERGSSASRLHSKSTHHFLVGKAILSYLECGFKLSLTSSGLTNWLWSKVLSAARLKSLFDLCSRTLGREACSLETFQPMPNMTGKSRIPTLTFSSGRALHCPRRVQRWPAGSSRRSTAESVAS